jgi:hypothetical protein
MRIMCPNGAICLSTDCWFSELANYLKLFGEDSCILIHFITFTKCFKIVDRKSFLNTQNPGTCGPLYIIQVNVYHYIRQVGSMESIKILFSSTDIWVMDYTVTVIVNKFINSTIYTFSSSLRQGAVETFMSSNQTRSFLPTKLSIDIYFSERFSSDSVRVVGEGGVVVRVYILTHLAGSGKIKRVTALFIRFQARSDAVPYGHNVSISSLKYHSI